MQLADGACAFKTQTVVFCVKRRKAGRFFMQKAATKILKPLDKYNGGGVVLKKHYQANET